MSDKNSNTGDMNTGYSNTGDMNTGNSNTGDWNTGDRNTGDWNTGNSNTGNSNTGDMNTGYSNTGNWNTGDRNTGFFCTETPSPMFFDKPAGLGWADAYDLIPFVDLPVGCEWVNTQDMTDDEKINNMSHQTTGGFLRVLEKSIQEAFPIAWEKMDEKTKHRFIDLPNFDPDKFFKCTGVDVRVKSRYITITEREIS